MYLLIPLLLLLLNVGCDDECVNCVQYSPNCIFLENVQNSECLAEDLQRSCEFYTCRSETYRFRIAENKSCVTLDCMTIQCDGVRSTIPTDDPNIGESIEQTGIINLFGLNQSNLPIGTVEVDDVLVGNIVEDFDCLLVQP